MLKRKLLIPAAFMCMGTWVIYSMSLQDGQVYWATIAGRESTMQLMIGFGILTYFFAIVSIFRKKHKF